MVQIINGGCNTRHPVSFCLSRPKGINNYVLLITKTPASFHIMEETCFVAANHAIILAPNTPYSYSRPDGEYMDSWLHFQTQEAALLFQPDKLPVNTFFPVDDAEFFSPYIRQLLWENSYTDAAYRQQNLELAFQLLLNHLTHQYRNKHLASCYSPYFMRIQAARLSMQETLHSPLSADDLALQLGISKSHFQHLYSQLFGISFQKDYIQMRIQYAKDLLETTDIPMEQILETCGYATEVHFYRQFKSITGTTPARYRKRFRNPHF